MTWDMDPAVRGFNGVINGQGYDTQVDIIDITNENIAHMPK